MARITSTSASDCASSRASRVSITSINKSGSSIESPSPSPIEMLFCCNYVTARRSRGSRVKLISTADPLSARSQRQSRTKSTTLKGLTKYSPRLRSPSKTLNPSFTSLLHFLAHSSPSPLPTYKSGCTFCCKSLNLFFNSLVSRAYFVGGKEKRVKYDVVGGGGGSRAWQEGQRGRREGRRTEQEGQ